MGCGWAILDRGIRTRATSYINRFSTGLKGLFAVGSGPGRFCVRSIEFGGTFVRVLRESGCVWVAAGGQVEFHAKPKFCSSRLCTVKNVSPGGFGTAGGQNYAYYAKSAQVSDAAGDLEIPV